MRYVGHVRMLASRIFALHLKHIRVKNVMKRLLVSFVLTVVITSFGVHGLWAQGDDREARAGLTIGPGFSAGGSIIAKTPELNKVKPIIAWRGEVSTTYPLSDIITAGLVLGVDSRGTRVHFHSNSDLYNNWRVNYFSFYPSFTFSGVNIGMNIGLPLSGTVTDPEGTSVDIEEGGVPGFGTSGALELPLLLEPRLGGVISLLDDETGWLSLTIFGGYGISELVDFPEPTDTFGDWRHFSLELGVRYEFLIPDTD